MRTVAAIIPVYNGAKWIARALASVFAQTRPVDEVIVIDDGSTDGSAAIVQSYDSRIQYVYQANRGVASARNHGARIARSEWIAFLDHDDEWLPHKIERQLTAVDLCSTASLCYTACRMHKLDGRTEIDSVPLSDLWPTTRLRNPFAPSVVMMRRRDFLALGGFLETLTRAGCEDWEFFVRFLLRYEAVEVREPLVNYYELESSNSRDYRRLLADTLSIVDGALLMDLTGLPRRLWRRRIRSVVYYRAAIAAHEAGDAYAAYLWQSIAEWPFPDVAPRRFKSVAAWTLTRHR